MNLRDFLSAEYRAWQDVQNLNFRVASVVLLPIAGALLFEVSLPPESTMLVLMSLVLLLAASLRAVVGGE